MSVIKFALLFFILLLYTGAAQGQNYAPGPAPNYGSGQRIYLPTGAWPFGQVLLQSTPPPAPNHLPGTPERGSYVWLKTGTDSLFVFYDGLWRPNRGGGGSVTVVQAGTGISVTAVVSGSLTTYTVNTTEASQTLYNQSGATTVFTGVPQNGIRVVTRSGLTKTNTGDYSLSWSAASGGTLTITWVRALVSENITITYQ